MQRIKGFDFMMTSDCFPFTVLVYSQLFILYITGSWNSDTLIYIAIPSCQFSTSITIQLRTP